MNKLFKCFLAFNIICFASGCSSNTANAEQAYSQDFITEPVPVVTTLVNVENNTETYQTETVIQETSLVETTETEALTQTETEVQTESVSEDISQATENYDIIDTKGLPNVKYGWYFNPNDKHVPPTASEKVNIDLYNAHYLGDTTQKIIYLTFDEGYENGFSSKILDVLKEKNVKAAFFVTKPYIQKNTELIKRMAQEGHIVGNHSVKHLSFPDLSDEQIKNELLETAEAYKEVTGMDMPKIVRPPMGEYSERTLAVTKNTGYKTIFWSFAYKDWLTDAQPGKDAAYNTVMSRYHNGAVMLLHAVSQSNTEALGDIIDSLREQGYSFGSLDDI